MCATIIQSYTPEDLLEMSDGDFYELVDGHLVKRNLGAEASAIAMQLGIELGIFLRGRGTRWVFGEGTGFQCFPDSPDKVRKPDVSVVDSRRLEHGTLPNGYLRLHPDLAVEVVSPNDLVYEIDEKVQEFLDADVPVVWVVNPQLKTVRVHRPDGTSVTLSGQDELVGEGFLEGFRCRVDQLFAKPPRPNPA
ncbi:MAG: Uma2 family endonuclease [Planctomycetales bacterium]